MPSPTGGKEREMTYSLLQIDLRSESVVQRANFDSLLDACKWHIKAWDERQHASPLVLLLPSGDRHCFNDSKAVAA
jgi:hypothetical protein